MTALELIDVLRTAVEDMNGGKDLEVRIAEQPHWPFEYSVDREATERAAGLCDGKLYIVEGRQIDYLRGEVRDAIGWTR